MDLSHSPTLMARSRLLGRNGWLALILLVAAVWCASARGDAFPLYLFKAQDAPVIAALIALLVLAERWTPRWLLPAVRPTRLHVAAAGLGLALLFWWGAHALLGDYPLSRDEVMVGFDMAVFAHGHLAEPLAAPWRSFAVDLVPAFLLNEDMPAGLVSAYLPGNALLRLAFSWVGDPALMNPALALSGGLALFAIARRLFGADTRAIWVVLIVYALSAQMALNAMTAYAMTGHMALNLVWLAAFLRGGRRGHVIAIAIGFVATGLHQIVFHPMFVAPFLLWRLREGRWRLVLAYGAAYGAIAALWIGYPLLAAQQAGLAGHANHSHANFFADRVWPLLVDRDPMTVPYMTLNLLRFVAWQNLALLPLLAAAAPLALRSRSIVAPMAWGIVGTILFMAVVLPFQGHGWGYRYLHAQLGCFALLAGFGYRRLCARKGRAADGLVLLLSAATLFGSMPWLLVQAHGFFAPHLAIEALISRQPGDFVLVDTEDPRGSAGQGWRPNAIDQVRNRPDLSNRPLRFSSRAMPERSLAELCRRGSVTLVTRADMQHVGFETVMPLAPSRFDAMIAQVRRADPACLRAAR